MSSNTLIAITVEVYPPVGWPVEKEAVKDWDRSQSEVTEACLTSLGFAIPAARRQTLRWAYKARTFWSVFAVVASARKDVVFGSADCERVKEAEERGAFPAVPAKKSSGKLLLLMGDVVETKKLTLALAPRVEERARGRQKEE